MNRGFGWSVVRQCVESMVRADSPEFARWRNTVPADFDASEPPRDDGAGGKRIDTSYA
ncbi:hypothetical protein [Burkholderia pyrrocinia]|uniref:hypothetical protein n=1 Tax=Burkholderia pyrrocinia TaxID=60550 RepID=UPI001BD018BE|nr:hypothetical protein [Burkholderia pyrrocinia]QVN21810.1 hypothetical protein JYG32_20735 [Burkholderia pyrrocinia]